MKFKHLNRLVDTLAQSHYKVGSGGAPIHNLYGGIVDWNPQLSKNEAKETFVNFVEYLLKEDMVELCGAYDKENDCEVRWEGSVEEIIYMLRNFIENLPPKKLEQASAYFYEFEYCFLVWKIEWDEVLKHSY